MTIAIRNKALVKEFFKCLEDGDAQKIASMFAEDGIHINPYASGLFPSRVQGQDAIKAYWKAPIENFGKMLFPIDKIYAMETGDIIFVKFTGRIELSTGGLYLNDYYSTFKFNEQHKIVEYVEIFNPIVAARSFGILDQIQ